MLQLCVHILKFLLSLPVIRREATHINDKVLSMVGYLRHIPIDSKTLEIHKILMEVRGKIENHQKPPYGVGKIRLASGLASNKFLGSGLSYFLGRAGLRVRMLKFELAYCAW